VEGIMFVLLFICSLFLHASPVPDKQDLLEKTAERMQNGFDMNELVDEWNSLFDKQNIQSDFIKHRSQWQKVFPIITPFSQRITGQRLYYDLFIKKYHYTILGDARRNQLVVQLKLHFYPSIKYQTIWKFMESEKVPIPQEYFTPKEMDRLLNLNVKLAQNLWNAQAPKNVVFEFIRVKNAQEADYSLGLTTGRTALYDQFIMAPAPSSILAHEIGHMLGLDDEYSIISNNLPNYRHMINEWRDPNHRVDDDVVRLWNLRCLLDSLMCYKRKLFPYHYNHVLGRLKM
jgi:hypothetical protein